jgi:dolichyl-phosphate-mannose--protein O-mannosyl transferase
VSEEPAPLSVPWVIALGSAVLLGLVLRVYAFDFPPGMCFDEHHFVENARNYLAHRPDWNDHPPLGKLIIAASISLFGDRALAWRLPALVFGLVSIGLGGWATARLFRSRDAGLVAAALLAADGFLISYSRIGTLDGYLAAALAVALLLSTFGWSARLAVLGGLTWGFAMSLKFSGLGAGAPLLLSLAMSTGPWRKKVALAVGLGVVAGAVYFGTYAYGLSLSGQPAGVGAVLGDTKRLLDHHAALTEMKNPFVSRWWTWVVPTRVLTMSWVESLGEVRVLTMLGNLATWWSAIACGLTAMAWRERADRRAVLVVLSGALAFLAPWVLSHRDSYLYHFLPSYLALVMLLAGRVAQVRAKWPTVAMGFICVVLVVAAIYAPLWSELPISPGAARARLFLEGWR